MRKNRLAGEMLLGRGAALAFSSVGATFPVETGRLSEAPSSIAT